MSSILPQMKYSSGIKRVTQVKFGGYNHTLACGEGEIYDEGNAASDNYPLISSRKKRYSLGTMSGFHGMVIAGDIYYILGTTLYKNGVTTGISTLFDCDYRMVAMGNYILLFGDTAARYYCYNTVDGTSKSLSASINITSATVVNNRISVSDYSSVDFTTCFNNGDGITLTSTYYTKIAIIRKVNAKSLEFDDNTFSTFLGTVSVTITREVPILDYIFECDNRLWGTHGNTIYVSKLGDPFNWNVFDGLSTDSFQVDVGSAGEFTGACCYKGYPCFFKENVIYKMYGSKPSNYQLLSSATLGANAGGAGLAIAGEVLYYLSPAGIVAYSGGIPQNISAPFGDKQYSAAVGASDGVKYYVSMKDSDGDYSLFVYDTRYGTWSREDRTEILASGYNAGLYIVCKVGDMAELRYIGENTPEGAVCESDFDSFVEFGDFTEGSVSKKGVSKLYIRLGLDSGATATVKIKYDGADEWQTVREITAENATKQLYSLPVIPRRCDRYRVKIEASGGFTLYSMAREHYFGSDV